MKPPLGSSLCAMAMRGSETPEETSANEEIVAREAVSCSSLASLLLCSEAAPSIMEHEKALLIAKEHDYAKTPNDYGLVQLTPLILQQIEKENCEAENLQAPKNEQNSEARRKVRSLVKKELLECHQTLLSGRRELLRESEKGIPGHLRELVAMQASLINTLQEQLHVREVELSTVRREKEQLEARLARMDRRLNILQKRSKDKEEQGNDSEGAAEHPETGGRVRHRKPSSLSHLIKADATPTTHSRPVRSRSSSVDHSKTRVHSSSACPSPSNQETTPKTVKRGPSEESNHSTSSKRSRPLVDTVTEMRTEMDYFGIDVDSLFPPVCYETEEGDGSVDTGGNQEIRIPSWRIEKLSTTSTRNSTITEDISDEVFQKRHSKPENEEKRRKRWDAQRIRRQCQYEHLLKKYMMKEGSLQTPERKKEKILTILPKLDQIEAIEISDTVIVSAFGQALPALPPSTFSLPGFDPAAKEVTRPSARTRTRNRPSSNNAGAGGGGTGKD